MYSIKRTRFFERSLKPYYKNHSLITQDIETILQTLQNNPKAGDQVPGFGGHLIFKIRVDSSKRSRGKSHTFRLTYFIHEESKTIVPLFCYAKNKFKKEAQIFAQINEALLKINMEI